MNRLRVAGCWIRTHWRALFLALAGLLTLSALGNPHLSLSREAYRYSFVLDITQSMNARDYHRAGLPADRLGYAKAAVSQVLERLPCGSEVGIGLFTTQTVHFLFEPLEVCAHFSVIKDVLAQVDWRMAWSADSHVEMGLYHALRELKKKANGTRLVFLTDGQETPPQTVRAQFGDKPGAIKGIVVGVGGLSPVSVPRFDRDNKLQGVWQNADIEKPPVSSTVYSEKVVIRQLPEEGPYQSWLDETHLRELSIATGLLYQRLDSPESLSQRLLKPELAEYRPTVTDIRPLLGLVALMVLLGSYWERGRPAVRSSATANPSARR